jgi:hypothetical protein
MTDPEAVATEKDHAVKAWSLFTHNRNFKARVPGWRETTAPDGSPRLVAEVVGPGAAHALRLFASQYPLVLGGVGDQRPGFDYSVPGRVTCVWRSSGVWVELWHPEPVAPAPEPVVAPAPEPVVAPSRMSLRKAFARPGGRLPFTRRSKTPKETPTA